MDPKNLSQLDPKLREAYERVMGASSQSQQPSPPVDPQPVDPPHADPPPPVAPAPPTESQAAPIMPPPQPDPTEPTPTIDPAPTPVNVPPPPPPPPSVAQNDPGYQSAPVPGQVESSTAVHPAASPNKIMPILIVIALVALLIVWAYFWVQLLL